MATNRDNTCIAIAGKRERGAVRQFPRCPSSTGPDGAGVRRTGEVEELAGLVRQIGPLASVPVKALAVLLVGRPRMDRVRERRAVPLARIALPLRRAGTGVVRLHEQWLALTGHAPVVTSDPAQKTYSIEFRWPQDSASEQVDPEATEQVTEQATEQATEQVTEQVAEQVQRTVLAVGQDVLSTSEIMERLALQHRPTVLYTYLTPALDAGLVEMTVPDKPRSSRQKYRLTDAGRALLAGMKGRRTNA